MPTQNAPLRAGLCGVVVALLATLSSGLAAQTEDRIVLTPAELRQTAVGALRTGNSARALALAEALLLRNAEESFALELAARAALDIEQPQTALERARTLYQTSTDQDQRFTAARIAALANTQLERWMRAQVWLRRARQIAPNEEVAASVAADYRLIRARSPLSLSFDFAIAPSSNINNGTSAETFDIRLFGTNLTLPFSASDQSLSGYQLSASARLGYRLSESPRHRTTLKFGVQAENYVLSSRSKELAPGFDISTRNSRSATIGVDHIWAAGDSGTPAFATLTYGQTWIDGATYASNVQANLGRQWALGENADLTGIASLARSQYRESDQTAVIWSTGLVWQYQLNDGRSVALRGTVGRSLSDASRFEYDFQSLGATYDAGRFADIVDVSFGFDHDWRSYRQVTRDDETLELTIAAGFPNAELYGFYPTVSLVRTSTMSDIERFQIKELSLDLNFQSSF